MGSKIDESSKIDRLVQDYIEQKMGFDAEIESYFQITYSNYLIKLINEQITQDAIILGQFWRKSYQNSLRINDFNVNDIEDIEIIDFEPFCDEEKSDSNQEEEKIDLRVTLLEEYIPKKVNLEPLNKYFNNKVSWIIKDEQKSKIQTNK